MFSTAYIIAQTSHSYRLYYTLYYTLYYILTYTLSFHTLGSGKSTIIKLITGEVNPPEGEVRRNPRLRVGVYNQHFVDRLPMEEDPGTASCVYCSIGVMFIFVLFCVLHVYCIILYHSNMHILTHIYAHMYLIYRIYLYIYSVILEAAVQRPDVSRLQEHAGQVRPRGACTYNTYPRPLR